MRHSGVHAFDTGCLDLKGISIINQWPPAHPKGVEKDRFLILDDDSKQLQRVNVKEHWQQHFACQQCGKLEETTWRLKEDKLLIITNHCKLM